MNIPETKIVHINAQTAGEMLTRNTKNRTISEATVRRYTQDMIAGRWTFDGAPIRFAKDGRLLDGQHRLTAVARTKNISIPFLVVEGLDDESQLVMDQGHKRTDAQQMSLQGRKNTTLKARVAHNMLVFENGLFFVDRKRQITSASEKIEWLDAHPDEESEIDANHSLMTNAPARATAVLTAYLMMRRVSAVDAEAFLRAFILGANLEEGNPILAVRNYLANRKMNRITVEDRVVFQLLFRAWNDWRDGRKRKIVRVEKCTSRTFPMPH